MSGSHPAEIYNTLHELLVEMECVEKQGEENSAKKSRRYWTKVWKRHTEKHGNVPLIMKCAVCSGTEWKEDIKRGRYKPARKSKVERDELKGNE